MNAAEWIRDNCCGEAEDFYINGLSYKIFKMNDGWFAVFKINDAGQYIPVIQANNMAHAIDYVSVREQVNFPLKQL